MSYTLTVSQVTFGGNGSDNPSPLTDANYDLSSEEQKLTFRPTNVIAPGETVGTKSVTSLIQLDPMTGQPMVGPNNLCWLPCPPYCK